MSHAHDKDEGRFIEAITRYQPVLEAFCHANLGHREDARDVLQNTSLKLWEKSAEWDPKTEFLPWAFAVARFTILSFLRDKQRERLVFDEEVVRLLAAESEAVASQLPDRRWALKSCLERLSEVQRSLLDSHYTARRTLREIAATTARTESAVKMTMMRLRQQLSQCIGSKLKQEHT